MYVFRTINNFTLQDIDRFWRKIDVRDVSQCWEWRGTRSGKYGVFARTHEGNTTGSHNHSAHRVAYLLYYNLESLPCLVCHSCDNPLCCNPHHLFAGTYRDNTQDMMGKKRYTQRQGELNTQAKLTSAQVLSIRALCNSGNVSPRQIADMFGVTRGTISDIKRRRSWAHV